MIIKINLLPPEQRPSPWALHRLCLAGLLALILLFGSVTGYYLVKIDRLEKALTETAQQSLLMQPLRQQVMAAAAEQQALAVKYSMVARVSSERQSCYGVLAYLGLVTPARVGLTEVLGNDQKQLLIKGTADSYTDVRGLLQRLEQDDFFMEPLLLKVENGTMDGKTVFEMSAKLKKY
ncbi:MAG TPA: PilN domain-containing protein [Patescibacteria group bacterium]|nr:PilN domain-containing protein [Patescibacteria group bacterium]